MPEPITIASKSNDSGIDNVLSSTNLRFNTYIKEKNHSLDSRFSHCLTPNNGEFANLKICEIETESIVWIWGVDAQTIVTNLVTIV
jgi:hypothetical protein